MIYKDIIEKHHDTIVANFEQSRVLENVLTPAQINELILYQFQKSDRVRWTDTSNNIQPICNVSNLFTDLDWIQPLFESELGDFSDIHSGNYFITTQLHDAHVDLLTESETNEHWAADLLLYKSCVIPLMISNNRPAFTAFFDQRHIGYSITLDRANQSLQEKSLYEISRDYPNFYLKDGTISPKSKYTVGNEYVFTHIDDRNLDDLTIEAVYEFKPGNIMLFDACQIHASCVPKSRPNYHWLKNGINIQFYKKV